MGFSPFLHSANLIVFVVVLYFHAGSSTTTTTITTPATATTATTSTSSVVSTATPSNDGSSTTTFTISTPITTTPAATDSASSVVFTATPSNNGSSTTPSQTTSISIRATLNPTTTTAAISTSSVVSTATPPKKTIVRLSCIQLETWKDTLQNSSSEDYQNLTKTVISALETLYSDSSKYDLDSSSIAVNFTKYGENVQINAEVGFDDVFDEESGVEDKFLESVKKRTLRIPKISEKNAKATPKGVTLGEWKAVDGECKRACSDSETSTGQSFNLVRTCTDGVYSCKGLRKKQTKDCKTYCDSSVASHLSFSLTGLVMAILAPLSLQL